MKKTIKAIKTTWNNNSILSGAVLLAALVALAYTLPRAITLVAECQEMTRMYENTPGADMLALKLVLAFVLEVWIALLSGCHMMNVIEANKKKKARRERAMQKVRNLHRG